MNFSSHPAPVYHLSLYVSDLEKSVAFYNSLWNGAPQKKKAGYAKWELPRMIFSLVENPEKVQSQFGHMGIRVETAEELQRALQYFQKLNFEIKEEMGTLCCYARQDKFWLVDPDGYQWEYYLFHEDVEFNDPHYSQRMQGAKEATACCSSAFAKPVSTHLEDAKMSCHPGSGCC